MAVLSKLMYLILMFLFLFGGDDNSGSKNSYSPSSANSYRSSNTYSRPDYDNQTNVDRGEVKKSVPVLITPQVAQSSLGKYVRLSSNPNIDLSIRETDLPEIGKIIMRSGICKELESLHTVDSDDRYLNARCSNASRSLMLAHSDGAWGYWEGAKLAD